MVHWRTFCESLMEAKGDGEDVDIFGFVEEEFVLGRAGQRMHAV